MGCGCGSIGRAVTSKAKGPRLGSSHQQNFKMNAFTVYFYLLLFNNMLSCTTFNTYETFSLLFGLIQFLSSFYHY